MPVSIAMNEADYCGLSTAPDANGDLAYGEGTKLGYRGLIANGTPARHPFGSGMGFARFEWSDVALAQGGVAVTVRNISSRAGSDVIQLYRDAPECVLLGFAKVRLDPGEERRVKITPEPRMMRFWEDGWQKLQYPVLVRVARSADDPGLPTEIQH
jgi:beta-glucosidase